MPANGKRQLPAGKSRSRLVWIQASLYNVIKQMIECGEMKEEDRILCLYVDEPHLLTLMEAMPGDTLIDQLLSRQSNKNPLK